MAMQNWWHDPLAKDIYNNLQAKEAEIPIFYSKSPQLRSRRTLVDWLAVINDSYNLCPTARQLSITLLDFFMDNYDVEEHLLKLVALGCLLVAAKFEEKEENIPKASSLNSYVPPPGYQLWEYLRMELTLLEFFQWRISLPTPAHFMDFLMVYSVLPTDNHGDRLIQDCSRVREYVKKYNNYFLEITLQDEFFRNLKPSLISAACIACSRICLNIFPRWSPQLAAASDIHWEQLNTAVIRMIKTYTVDEEAQRQKQQSANSDANSTGNSPCSSSSGSPASNLSVCSTDTESLKDFCKAGTYFTVHPDTLVFIT